MQGLQERCCASLAAPLVSSSRLCPDPARAGPARAEGQGQVLGSHLYLNEIRERARAFNEQKLKKFVAWFFETSFDRDFQSKSATFFGLLLGPAFGP